eukprot:tig00000171_g10958.t1
MAATPLDAHPVGPGPRGVSVALLELGCPVDDAAYAVEEEGARAPEAALPSPPSAATLSSELLARGASPGARHGHKAGPYELAALGGHFEVLRELVARAAPPAEVVESIAAGSAREGSAACLRVALDAGADPRRRVKENSAWLTPLLMAAGNGHLGCVRELLERGRTPARSRGAPPRRTPEQEEEDEAEGRPPPPEYVLAGYSALERAARGGHAAVVRLLASRGAPVDRPDSGLNSALGLAAKEGRLEAALKASGVLDSAWCPALHAAAFNFDIPSVREKGAAGGGAPVNQADASNRTPIMRPLASSAHEKAPLMLKTLQELLRAGADPFYGWQDTCTIEQNLLYQVSGMYTKNRLTILAFLIERGAALKAKDAEKEEEGRGRGRGRGEARGRTPLLVAVAASKGEDGLETVRALLDAGADIGARDAEGRSAAAIAAAAADLELLRLLMGRGAGATRTRARSSLPPAARAAAGGTAAAPRPATSSVLLEDELKEVSVEGFAWPAVRRDADGSLSGRAKGYSTALGEAMRDGSEMAAEDARQWADLLLCCRGPIRLSEIHALKPEDTGGDARGPLVAAATRVLRLEGRVEPEPPEDPKKTKKKAKGQEDEEEEAEQEDPAEADARDRETPLHAACRVGLRLTALRLAAAATRRPSTRWTRRRRRPSRGRRLRARPLRRADIGRQVGGATAEAAVRPETSTARNEPKKSLLNGSGRAVLDGTRDAAYRAQLKRAAAVRDAFISYGHHPPEVARFTAQLRDRLQAEQVSCWVRLCFNPLLRPRSEADARCPPPDGRNEGDGYAMRFAWREQIGAGIKAARAVIFVASKAGAAPRPPPPSSASDRSAPLPQHSCASDWCMLELSRARDLGRPIFPVWAEAPFPLDDRPPCACTPSPPPLLTVPPQGLLRGCRIVDLSRPALLEAGFPAFLAEVRGALEAAAAADDAADADAARARPSPLTFPALPLLISEPCAGAAGAARGALRPRRAPSCSPGPAEDARNAASLLSALAFRGVPCWLHCPVPTPPVLPTHPRIFLTAAQGADPTERRGGRCAGGRARAAGRPVRPLLLSSLQASAPPAPPRLKLRPPAGQVPASLEYSLARTRKFPSSPKSPRASSRARSGAV